ncbi:cutinase family protein [Williamsia sp.]|uniref:cutinase family protein n=1 Tax=Williamsia sp. TaxID=1872085 RepID=UPI002F92A631
MSREQSRTGSGAATLMDRRSRGWRPAVAIVFASLAATMAMGVVPALVQSNASARPISDCPDLHVVAVPGTLDSSVNRDPHDQRGILAPVIADAQRDAPPGSMQTTYVPYPADFGYTSNGTPYAQSVDAGVTATEAQIAQINRRCGPDTEIAIVGYSQGAQIANRVAVNIGAGKGPVPASQVRGVYLISDPNRSVGADLVPGAPGLSAPLNGAWTTAPRSDAALGGGMGAGRDAQFGALTGRVVSLCMTGDFACAIPDNAQAVRIGANVAEQIHIDTTDPGQIAADLGRVVLRSTLLTGLHVVTTPHWMLSSETLGDVVAATTDPSYTVPDYTDPIRLLRSGYGVATFATEAPNVWQAKLSQELVLGVKNNVGILLMAAHPEYWYPGPSHGSYFTDRDQTGRTGTNYVSSWLRESAVSGAPSGSAEPVPVPATPTPPVSNPVANNVTTGVAVASVGAAVTRQLPAVADALTDEVDNLAEGSQIEAAVTDVTEVIDQGAAQVEQVFEVVDQTIAQVEEVVDTVAPVIDTIANVIDTVDQFVDVTNGGDVADVTDAGPAGPAGSFQLSDVLPIGATALNS